MKKLSRLALLMGLVFFIQNPLFSQATDHHDSDASVSHQDPDHAESEATEGDHHEDTAAEHHAEASDVHDASSSSEHAEVATEGHTEEHGEDNSGGHGADMSPLFFIIVALLMGAAVRHLLRKSPLPFTVWLLLIG